MPTAVSASSLRVQARLSVRSAVCRPNPLRICARSKWSSVVVRSNAEEAISGEWPMNWSLSSYDDVSEYLSNKIYKEHIQPTYVLSDVMSTEVVTVKPEDSLAEIKAKFDNVSGLPVVNEEGKCIGVISKKDAEKGGATVADAFSTPPVVAKKDSKVVDASILMLKHKVHRIPIVDDTMQVVGIVSRTDIFTALAVSSADS